ncbi:hypothetical protein CDCA_CDCA10G2968 [Cyanidium caldarium]|uniref:Sigma 54 modulation/S30EA ribosomal protein C-terminal domain-containing protein n=1 Tax=Cyanidium caldarium TaxID=2771 RepID=A0AAV9IYQ9_CYACA|nr:hypothetical protein CDCA_CDCA10G2968 [Cyanidium caldarium]
MNTLRSSGTAFLLNATVWQGVTRGHQRVNGYWGSFVSGGPPTAVQPLVVSRVPRRGAALPIRASTDAATNPGVPLTITGNNVDLNESLRSFVKDKIGRVMAKHRGLATRVDVHLAVAHNPRIRNACDCEVTVHVRGRVLRSSVKSESMQGSVDMAADKLKRTIRKYKERHTAHSGHEGVVEFAVEAGQMPETELADGLNAPRVGTTEAEAEDPVYGGSKRKTQVESELEEMGVEPARDVVRKKKFPMPLQTVEEAVLCLEYIDHDFYVFRNADTKEINVVYRRNHGGVGLIEPEA